METLMARPLPNAFWWPVIDWLGDKTAIPDWLPHSVLSVSYGAGTVESPDWKNLDVRLFERAPDALYQNGIFFFRFAVPFFVGFMLRWSGRTDCAAYLQTHIGWKLNGRLAVAFRVQSDASAEIGMDAPNLGQAKGWARGSK
jgi:hypothetical protein